MSHHTLLICIITLCNLFNIDVTKCNHLHVHTNNVGQLMCVCMWRIFNVCMYERVRGKEGGGECVCVCVCVCVWCACVCALFWFSCVKLLNSLLPCLPAFQIVKYFHFVRTNSSIAFTRKHQIVSLPKTKYGLHNYNICRTGTELKFPHNY